MTVKDKVLRINFVLALIYCNSLDQDCILDILPTSYSTTLYFSIDEMQDLKGSPAFGEKFKFM